MLILIFASCKSSNDIAGDYSHITPYYFFKIKLVEDKTFIAAFEQYGRLVESSGTWSRISHDSVILNSYRKYRNDFDVTKANDPDNTSYTVLSIDEEGNRLNGANYTLHENGKSEVLYPSEDGKLFLEGESGFSSLTIEHLGYKTINYKLEKNFNTYIFQMVWNPVEDFTYWFFEDDTLHIKNNKLRYKKVVLEKRN